MAHMPLSVIIITLNEEANLPRALKSVAWADEVIVVDSGSLDRTQQIACELGARVFERPWTGYGQQKNFAQTLAKNDWILNLDADEVVSHSLAHEIQATLQNAAQNPTAPLGYYIPRKTFYLGRWIRYGGWYPNYLMRLANKNHASWSEPPVHEAWEIQGPTAELQAPLLHFSFNSISDQVLTNLRFAQLGSQALLQKGRRPSLVQALLRPIGKFIETYLIKRGFLDGTAGLIISLNAAYSVFMKYSFLLEDRIRIHENSDY